MENNMGEWEKKNLVRELTMGRELARQLQFHLSMPSSPRETCEMLVQKILSSNEKALSMLNFSNSLARDPYPTGIVSESPSSLSGSPRSEDSDRDFKDQGPKDGSRKRKTTPRWTQQVRVSPGMGLEGPLDDGFSWRKYGQKDILGAKYPRGYYRCTNRIVQGCLAKKQVQRSDEDPTIFEITYRGTHTCTQTSKSNVFPPSHPSENHELDPKQNQLHLPNFASGLRVITQDLDSRDQSLIPRNFHFPSTSNINNVEAESPVFSPSMMGTNYFPVSSSTMTGRYGGNQNFHSGESAATSASNSPTFGLDFPFDNVEFDPNFTFDHPAFLP